MPKKVEIIPVNGVPSLHYDGVPVSPAAVYLFRMDPEEIRRFAATGIHLYTFRMKLAQDETFAEFDEMVDVLLEADPKAAFFPRLFLDPPAEWLAANTAEITMDEMGVHYGVSFASEAWLRRMTPVLERFIAHMETNCGDQIIGYHLAAGYCGEWFWGAGQYLDYSPAGQLAWQRWARDKFQGRVDLMNKRWQFDSVLPDFEQLRPPTVAQRISADWSGFRDPEKRRFVIDYDEFLQDITADRIIHFAETAKNCCGDSKIVGVFYGYIEDVTGYQEANQVQGCAHAGIAKVLRSKSVDFIASPMNYYDRRAGGSDRSHCAIESFALHGKLYYYEIDTRTSLANFEEPFPDLRIEDLHESTEVLKRNFCYALCKSSGLWWMELKGEGWYNHPDFLAVLEKGQRILHAELGQAGQSVAEIAVVLDEKAPLHLTPASGALHANVYYQLAQISKIGAPFDVYMLSDIEKIPQRYKLYIFPALFCPNRKQRRQIKLRLQQASATAIWLYAPGIGDENGLALEKAESLTGIRLDFLDAATNIRVAVDARHELPANDTAFVYGGEWRGASNRGFTLKHPNTPLRPVFYAADQRATVLGRINVDARPGLVVGQLDDWKSVYSAIGALPANMLRNIAADAGVHLYSRDNDVIYANSRWLALHALGTGRRHISMPQSCHVEEVFSGSTMCEAQSGFELDVSKNCTYLLSVRVH